MRHKCHIVITRPIEQAQRLADELRARGAIPVLYPGLMFGPMDDPVAFEQALREADDGAYDIMILTSPQAARVVSERMAQMGVSLAERDVWVVGERTAAACQFEAKMHVPTQARDANTLLDALPDLKGQRVLLPQSPLARSTLSDELIAQGAHVTVVHPYSVIAGDGGDDVPALIRAGEIAAFTFFSGSAVEGVMARLEAAGLTRDAVSGIPAVCFGGSTAAVAREMGLAALEGDTTYETFYRLVAEACEKL